MSERARRPNPPQLERLAVSDAERRVAIDLARRTEDQHPDRALVIGAAGALFLAIFALRLAVDDPPALIANFYTVPTALLAVAYGVRAGVAGALVATALVALWHAVEPVDVSFLGYASRFAVVLLVGVCVGYYSQRLRRDIAARREAERELALRAEDLARSNSRLEEAVRRLDALATIARATGAETDLRAALDRMVAQADELASGASLSVWVAQGADDLALIAGSAPPDEGSAEVVRVPLEHRGETLGLLLAVPRPGGPAPDPQMLAAVSASAASAIVTARSVTAERLRDAIAASERERSRWAWELHDETLQRLVGLRVLLSSALRTGEPQPVAAAVGEALDELQVEISNLKHLIAELRPAALDELGLDAALRNLCERTAATSGAEVDVSVEITVPLSPEIETTVYRVAQEALTNVGKHATAEHVSVTLQPSGEMVELRVADDGRGFDASVGSGGFGLRGMSERAELAGGRVEVTSGPKGTRVVASLPAVPVFRSPAP